MKPFLFLLLALGIKGAEPLRVFIGSGEKTHGHDDKPHANPAYQTILKMGARQCRVFH